MGRRVVAIGLVAAAVACSGGGDGVHDAVRVDSAGAEIVESPGTDRLLDWRFEPRFTLGGETEGPEQFYGVSVYNVATDGAAHVYVLDASANQVVVFDDSGEYVRILGGTGEGPGELARPASLAVSAQGVVSVFDWGKGGLVRWDSTGAVLPEHRFAYFPIPVFQRHFAEVEDGFLVASGIAAAQDGDRRQALRFVSETDSAIVAEVRTPRSEMHWYASCGGGLNLPPLFSPELSWGVVGGRVAAVSSPAYNIDVSAVERDAEIGAFRVRTVRSVRRAFPVRSATRDLALEELGEGMNVNFGQGPCRLPPAEMVDARGYAEFVPWIRRIMLAPDGTLWVERREIGVDAHGPIDVFDATGAYAGTLPEGTPFPLIFLTATRVGYAERDELDVERLVIADIVRTSNSGQRE